MKSLVTAYLAAFMFAFRAHHNIKGSTFVADHGFLGEFYNAYLTEADGIIGKGLRYAKLIGEGETGDYLPA